MKSEISVNFLRSIAISMIVLMVSATVLNFAFASSSADVAKEFQWIDLSSCKKPSKSPPRAQKESYETYNIQRRYVDLDQDGACEVMDLWIERLGGNPSPGMRVLEQSHFRYKGGNWQKYSTSPTLKFYPYLLRLLKTGETVYVEAPSDSDVSDNIVLGMQEIRIFFPPVWDETPGFLDDLILKPYQGRPGPILQALAVLLTERFARQEAEPGKRLAGNPRFPWSPDEEQKKIQWILKEANQTLRPEERIAVDSSGLPLLQEK
ncbi:hypothetical protein GJV26_26125 [Massilia dura]|uniref:Uncharacterized protein n=1 Tax=Pseudoduganella dura TaxID=321982 RepID=A0A6I3XMY3_9BURK|nr:hypothetical protein [Pseudoduganella dura]MUI15910.1 hypothetical protein [Pseudoduganella dura]GGX94520.1 hypothetical protein GCM10007386_26740 [Pseudoduganella dura]